VSERLGALGTLVPAQIEAATQAYKRLGVAFGDRFFTLLLLGLVWIVPAFFDLRFVYALLAWDSLVVLAWLGDLASEKLTNATASLPPLIRKSRF